MPINFTDMTYSEPLRWIRRKRERGTEWDTIADKPSSSSLSDFLSNKEEDDGWPKLDEQTWKEMVRFQEENEKKISDLDVMKGHALVIDGSSNNDVYLPDGDMSCWQLYKKKLERNGFSEESIGEIERATLKILRRLSDDTRNSEPVKGLVIGNVQSGKTANMAALMAMAADWGWNMFIVLSGTIENLRKQTQTRLFTDLNNADVVSNLTWLSLEHLSPRSPIGSRAQDLHFEENSRQRYFTVSLKNSARLEGLIQWLQRDRAKMQQMKILVIDDEADQAGINTADVKSTERRKINKLICALVNGLDHDAKAIEDRYRAMNYIGYTATPYANILNEASLASLYPRNFLATLSVPNLYFGPQQIFGSPDGKYGGLDIIRTVSKEDLKAIKDIHKGDSDTLPDSFMDSVCWFTCCVAAMRLRGYRKPISMLVHTSQQVLHHSRVSDLVVDWMNNTDRQELLDRCRRIWDSETGQLPLDEFKEQYPDYGLLDSVSDYPSFDEIEDGVRKVISIDLKPISMDQKGELTYHEGIHLCVDNSKNNGVNDEDEYLRLVYPDKEHMPDVAPAFLVIGGATLSRGLTLEGLVTTFFLRSVKQADTLMQMGRWFGYRRGYELYPRVWLTQNTQDQFQYLSIMDQELREEIHMMEVCGLTPDRYAARIRNTPKLSLIRITAKNRMQGVMDADMDFSGSFSQTYLFDEDKDILEKNLDAGRSFIESLGAPRPRKACNPHSSHAFVWEDVTFDRIKEFLRAFHFNKNLLVFNDLNPLFTWVEKITGEGNLKNWNVVLAGKKQVEPGHTWDLDNCSVAKVIRTRKNTKVEKKDVINIGALRAPGDLVADVDLEGQSDEVLALFSHLAESRMKEARTLAGLGETPQLLLYVVDKDSKPKPDSTSRKDLDAPCDLLGVCVNIPGGAVGANCVARVSINLGTLLPDVSDISEEDEQDNQ